MKKILLLMTVVLLLAAEGFSQAPGILNYQGVARNSVGNVLVNQNITLRLTIRNLTAAGAVVYQESRAVTTNPFGLFNVQLGSPGASGVTGTIPGVNWAVGAKFIQVEIDPNGGSSFINIGTAQLASVPYSLFATTAGDLILPFNKTQNDNGTLFKITNSGTNSGSSALEGLTNSTAGSANAIIGTVTSTAPGGFSAGVRGINNGTGGLGIGVYGSHAGSGWGVYGTTQSGIGVNGNATSGIGVNGNSTSGTGVYGNSNTGVAGIFTITNAASTADALQANTTGTGWAATIISSNATPRALRTTGGLRFTGINEANNRILTSDAAGNALWKDAAAVGIVTGSGTLDRVPKWTPNGTTLGDSRIEDRAGALQVGINTPAGYTYTSGQPGFEMTNSTALLQTRILLRDESDGGDVQGFMDARTSPTATVSALQLGTLTNHPITFFGNGVHMGRWSAAGNLGIGTTAGVDPSARLQVDNAGTIGSFLLNQTNAANTVPAMTVINANATATAYGNGAIYGQRGVAPGGTNFLLTGVHTAVTGITGGATGVGVQGSGNTAGVIGVTNTGIGVYAVAVDPTGYGLQTNGRVQIAGQGAGLNKVLTSDAAGNATWQTLGGGVGVGGAGTLNFVSKWTPNGTNLGNSQLFDDGTNVGLGTITPTEKFEINSGGAGAIGFKNEGTSPAVLLNTTSATGIERIYFGTGSNARIFFNKQGLFTDHLLLTTSSSGNTPDITINKANTNVGIGRVNAGAKLHVDGSIDLSQTLGAVNFTHQALIAQTSSTATATVARSIIGYAGNSSSENHGLFTYPNGGGGAFNVGVFSFAIAATTGNNYGYYANVANSTNANIGIQVNVPNGPNDRAGVFVGKVQIADGTQAAGRIYTSDATGTGSWQTAAAAGVVSGSGTLNYVPKWTPNGATLGNSLIQDDGNAIKLGNSAYYNNNSLNVYPSPTSPEPAIMIGDGEVGGIYLEQATGNMHITLNGSDVATGNKVMTFDDDNLSVGIGTTSPTTKLQVVQTDATAIRSEVNYTTPQGLFSQRAANIFAGTKSNAGLVSFNNLVSTPDLIPGWTSAVIGVDSSNDNFASGVAGFYKGNTPAIGVYGRSAQNFNFATSATVNNLGFIGGNFLGGDVGVAAMVTGSGSSVNKYAVWAQNLGGGTNWAGYFLGQVAIKDGTEGTGKVLTSDASGNASWQENTSQSVGISIRGLSAPVVVPNNTLTPITQWVVIDNEDGGANYNGGTGEYTITKTGVYQVSSGIAWAPGMNANDLRIYVLVDGIQDYGTLEHSGSGGGFSYCSLSYTKRFVAGKKISISVFHNSGVNQNTQGLNIENSFSVHFLHN